MLRLPNLSQSEIDRTQRPRRRVQIVIGLTWYRAGTPQVLAVKGLSRASSHPGCYASPPEIRIIMLSNKLDKYVTHHNNTNPNVLALFSSMETNFEARSSLEPKMVVTRWKYIDSACFGGVYGGGLGGDYFFPALIN